MALDTRIPLMAQGIQMPDFNALAMQKDQQAQNAFTMNRMQQQDAQQQAALQRRQQVGGMAAGGDLAGAGKAALEGGDFDLAAVVSGLSGEQSKAAAQRNKTLAAVALSIADLPYEQRRQGIAGAMPYLQQSGISPEMIEQFDPTDENIAGIVSVTQDFDKMMEARNKQNEPYTLSQGQSRFVGGNQIASVAPDPKYITTPEGATSTLVNGSVMAASSGGNIPFDALIGIESGGNHFAKSGGVLTSPKGAIGIAQVMPGTAPEAAAAAGLPWDEGRYHSDQNYNRALGEAYYNRMRQRYGDDIKAAAAYNAGPGAVDKALQGGGDWISRLPRETQNYIDKLSPRNAVAGGPPSVIRGAPKRSPATEQQKPPSGYRWTANGDLQPIPGGPAVGGGAQGTKQQQGLAKTKLTSLRSVESQLGRIDKALAGLEKDGFAGPIGGLVPSSFDAASDTFETAVAGLTPLIEALTRVPGVGSTSDYEAKLKAAMMPSRRQTKEGRAEAVAAMKELVANIKAANEEFLGIGPAAAPQGGGNVIRYDAKGNRIK